MKKSAADPFHICRLMPEPRKRAKKREMRAKSPRGQGALVKAGAAEEKRPRALDAEADRGKRRAKEPRCARKAAVRIGEREDARSSAQRSQNRSGVSPAAMRWHRREAKDGYALADEAAAALKETSSLCARVAPGQRDGYAA